MFTSRSASPAATHGAGGSAVPWFLGVFLMVVVLAALLIGFPVGPSAEAASSANFAVSVSDDMISGGGWEGGTDHVTITIDDPATPQNPDYTDTAPIMVGSFSTDVGYVFDVKPGHIVRVDDGSNHKMHVVTHVAISFVDSAADTVTGTATPGAPIGVWISYHTASIMTVADGSGRWTVDFDGVWDVTGGNIVGVREYDSDGDSTQVTMFVLPDGASIHGFSLLSWTNPLVRLQFRGHPSSRKR